MSLDDVAKVTKIQPRILERLEAGRLDGLPAEVFVRGFVRSFARCVGLDEREALRRYAECALGTQDLAPTVRALVEVMADLAPGSATAARATPRKMQAVEVIDLVGPVVLTAPAGPAAPGASIEAPAPVEAAAPIATAVEAPVPPATVPAEAIPASEPATAAAERTAPPVEAAAPPLSSRKKRNRRRRAREAAARAAAEMAAAAAAESSEAPHDPSSDAANEASSDASNDALLEAADANEAPNEASNEAPNEAPDEASNEALNDAPSEAAASNGAAASREPRAEGTPAVVASSAPWRRLVRRAPAPAAPARPSLVIDDADPESAERVQEQRAEGADALAPRRSFLPPILLDREDRSARQGGLTLAVILLLIAATLTLSYLMRRPSASGDGMTGREPPGLRSERG